MAICLCDDGGWSTAAGYSGELERMARRSRLRLLQSDCVGGLRDCQWHERWTGGGSRRTGQRGKHCFICLNAFPYTSGHVMVMPYAHLDRLAGMPAEAAHELMDLGTGTEHALKQLYRPHGFNFGMNLGQAAGAGVAGTLAFACAAAMDGRYELYDYGGGDAGAAGGPGHDVEKAARGVCGFDEVEPRYSLRIETTTSGSGIGAFGFQIRTSAMPWNAPQNATTSASGSPRLNCCLRCPRMTSGRLA